MRTRALFLFLAGLLLSFYVQAEIVVVVHPESSIQQLTARQISDLYLGRTRGLITIFEQPNDSKERENFFRSLNGMSLQQINAYWARLRFSGEVLPPVALANSRSVLDAVSRNRNALGYIGAHDVTSAVRVVLRLSD